MIYWWNAWKHKRRLELCKLLSLLCGVILHVCFDHWTSWWNMWWVIIPRSLPTSIIMFEVFVDKRYYAEIFTKKCYYVEVFNYQRVLLCQDLCRQVLLCQSFYHTSVIMPISLPASDTSLRKMVLDSDDLLTWYTWCLCVSCEF